MVLSSLFLQLFQELKAPEVGNFSSQQVYFKISFFQKVPHKFVLRGYAVTPLRIWYCINKYTLEAIDTLPKYLSEDIVAST